MIENIYLGDERRQFARLDYAVPLAYKVCREETISKILEGYTADISQAGLLCNLKENIGLNDLLWLSFDRSTLTVCEEMERRSLIYQNGIIGRVVRSESRSDGTFDVGIQFVTREEKNLTYIYPNMHFLKIKEEGGKVNEGT